MQLFYNSTVTENDSIFSFSKDESRHIIKVLRKKIGDKLYITNGNGWLFTTELIIADQKNCSVNLIDKTFYKKRDYTLHLAVAPTKMNDRFEWFLEKATEIGVDTITPILCDHSERKFIKNERFQKIIQSAMKQSLQFYLPKLMPLTPFNQFIKQDFKGDLFIAHCEDSNKKSLKTELTPKSNTTILIGPEGDFSIQEIETAIAQKFNPVTLGNTRLRTETAAIVACHTLAYTNQL